jgi:hypothetical protein
VVDEYLLFNLYALAATNFTYVTLDAKPHAWLENALLQKRFVYVVTIGHSSTIPPPWAERCERFARGLDATHALSFERKSMHFSAEA